MDSFRFNNNLGDEYDLFSLVLPHQDVIQKESVSLLRKNILSKTFPNVLEIGFGTGITTLEILKIFESIKLTSIDNEKKMLPRARRRLINNGFDPTCFFIAEAKNFLKNQDNNSFDGIISVWVVHNLLKEEQQEILREIYRVLKPGGVFINGDKIVIDDPTQYQKDFEWQMKQFDLFSNIDREDLNISWKKHYEEDTDPSRKITESEYKELIEKVGFSKTSFSNRNHLDVICIAFK